MGQLISKLLELFLELATTESQILMLGLDGAGKTTMLYRLKLHQTIVTIPTIGFNVEKVTPINGLTFTVWDVGGETRIRKLWNNYFHNTDGLIYVVDSCDEKRLPEAREELFKILDSDHMKYVPVCVMANKQDKPNALSISRITEDLRLRNMTDRKWYIQPTIATNAQGLYEGVNKLALMVKDFQTRKDGTPV